MYLKENGLFKSITTQHYVKYYKLVKKFLNIIKCVFSIQISNSLINVIKVVLPC